MTAVPRRLPHHSLTPHHRKLARTADVILPAFLRSPTAWLQLHQGRKGSMLHLRQPLPVDICATAASHVMHPDLAVSGACGHHSIACMH